MSEFGKVFYKRLSDVLYYDNCIGCGRKRQNTDEKCPRFGDSNCANCGKSYGYFKPRIAKLYVIGVYEMFNGEKGYQLSETSPENYEDNMHNGKGVSYWSYEISNLGTDFFKTKKEVKL